MELERECRQISRRADDMAAWPRAVHDGRHGQHGQNGRKTDSAAWGYGKLRSFQVAALASTSRTLATLRDALLPGELRLPATGNIIASTARKE